MFGDDDPGPGCSVAVTCLVMLMRLQSFSWDMVVARVSDVHAYFKLNGTSKSSQCGLDNLVEWDMAELLF